MVSSLFDYCLIVMGGGQRMVSMKQFLIFIYLDLVLFSILLPFRLFYSNVVEFFVLLYVRVQLDVNIAVLSANCASWVVGISAV